MIREVLATVTNTTKQDDYDELEKSTASDKDLNALVRAMNVMRSHNLTNKA